MFNSTHTFVGLLIARMPANKWGRHATATAVIASNLPDLDSIAGFWSTVAYLDYHRGITHTLIGVPILAFLLSTVMYFFSRNFGRTYAVALIAMATHPLLDYMNPYGWRPFLPWNGTWYYGDIVFIFDPYLDLALLAGIFWGTLRPSRKRIAALVSFCLAIAYIGTRIELHALAAAKLGAVTQMRGFANWAVLPQMLNPLHWNGIVATENGVLNVPLASLGDSVVSIDNIRQMDPVIPSPIVTQAEGTRSAAALLRFARFPVTRVEPLASGYRVIFMDSHTPLTAEILLDRSLNVINEILFFDRFRRGNS